MSMRAAFKRRRDESNAVAEAANHQNRCDAGEEFRRYMIERWAAGKMGDDEVATIAYHSVASGNQAWILLQ